MEKQGLSKIKNKLDAQNLLMQGMQVALTSAGEDDNISKEVLLEMIKQFARVEKLFGYVVYLWVRGV